MSRRSGWLGAVAVAAALAVASLGGYAVAASLEEPAGSPLGVGGVLVRPLGGWAVASRGEVGGWRFLRLTRGTGNLDVAVHEEVSATTAGGAIGYVNEVLRRSLGRLTVSQRLEPVRLPAGAEGVRFSYAGVVSQTGQSIEGQVTVAAGSAGDLVFDAWALEGQLPFVLDDVQAMLEGASIDGA